MSSSQQGIIDREGKNYMKNIKRGLLWGVLFVGADAISRRVRKDTAPPTSMASALATTISALVISFGVDVGKGEGWLPDYV